MEQSQDDYPLLSRYDLHTLGFIKVDPEGAYATNKVYSENDFSDEEFAAEVTKLHKKYAKVFIGVGTYKHHTVDLQVKRDADPFILSAIPCPIHLRDKAIERLNHFIKLGILEPVKTGHQLNTAVYSLYY